MLTFELMENTLTEVTYKYFPDGGKDFGIIKVRKKDNAIITKIIANEDDFEWCLLHMYQKIKDYIESNEFKEKGTIAWY